MDRSAFNSTVQIHAQMLAARALLFAVLPNIISSTTLDQRQGIIDRLMDQANEIPPMANPSHPDETEVYEKTVEVVHEEISRLAEGLRQAFGLNDSA